MKKTPGFLMPILAWFGGLTILAALCLWLILTLSLQKLEDTKAELERQGETFDVAKLAPPSPPEENNSAENLTEAARELHDTIKAKSLKLFSSGQIKSGLGKAEVAHKRPAVRRNSEEVSWAEFVSLLEPVRPSLAKIRQEAKTPILDIQPDYTKGFAISQPYAGTFLSAGQYLAIENLIYLREGNTAIPVENIETQLRLVRLLTRQPLLISQLVAVAIIGNCQVATWEILHASPTPDELKKLQAAWEGISVKEALPDTLRMERIIALTAFSTLSAESYRGIFSRFSPLEDATGTMLFHTWYISYRYTDERLLIENLQTLIESLEGKKPWRTILDQSQSLENDLASSGLNRLLSRLILPAILSSLKKFAVVDALRNLIITAIAIQRFQIDHNGIPPENLLALYPKYAPEAHLRDTDGLSLKYKRDGKNFLLYSVGENNIDDGGNPDSSPGKRRRDLLDGLDIVWPQAISPVTPAPAE